MERKPGENLRDDENVRKSGELIVGQFKYLPGLCWAPIIIVLAFFRGDASEFGLVGKILVTLPVCSLMVAGSIFFFAYQKQTLMIAHGLLGEEAVELVAEVNPDVYREIATNVEVARRLGHLANDKAFPLMTVSYILLAFAAILAIWL